MFVAVVNFIAGKEHSYSKGQEVHASGELLERLKQEGLVEEKSNGHSEPKAQVEAEEEAPKKHKKSKKHS